MFHKQSFGPAVGSRESHNDTDIGEKAMDVEQSRHSAIPPSPYPASSLSAFLHQIPNRASPGGDRDVQQIQGDLMYFKYQTE